MNPADQAVSVKSLIHIGSPKAGSSFLQSASACWRDDLRRQGIWFPTGTRHDEQRMLAGEISGGNALLLARQVWAGDWSRAEASLAQFQQQAIARGCDRVLLSSEWFLGALAQPGRMVEFCRRLGQPGTRELEFLLILRDPVSQLISHYKHRAKSGTAGSLDEWAKTHYLLPERLSAIRQQCQQSEVNLVVRAYGKQSGALETLFFSDWLGVDIRVPERLGQVNPSLSLSELMLIRALRRARPALVPHLYERLLALDASQKCEGQAMQNHARQVAANTVAKSAEEWRAWNAMLPEAERLVVPSAQEQPVSPPREVELSSAQLSVVIDFLAEAATLRFVLALWWSGTLRPALARFKRGLIPGATGARR